MAFATRRVIKGPQGKPHIVFVDPSTGVPIPYDEIENYELIEQGDDLDIPQHKKKDKEEEKKEQGSGEGSGFIFEGGGPWTETQTNIGPRSLTNNFGYISKPAFISLLSNVPGILGTFGKGINLAINVNNLSAVNAARSAIGLPSQSFGESAKGVISDNKGYVGDVVIGNTQYAIGLEGQTKSGRTTLTPKEAQARVAMAQARNQEARAASPQEAKAADKAHEADFGVRNDFSSPKGIARAAVNEFLKTVRNEDTKATQPAATTPAAQSPTTPVAQPGKGLASLAPNGLRGSTTGGFNPQYGPQTVGPAQQDLVNAVVAAVQNAFGPGYTVNATSGARTNSANHADGRAIDFNVTDPNGNRVTDQNAMEALAAELGNQGIQSLGYGQGYMGPGMMHAGVAPSPVGSRSWGALGKAVNADPGVQQAFLGNLSPTGILPGQVNAIPSTSPGPPGPPGSGAVNVSGLVPNSYVSESSNKGESSEGNSIANPHTMLGLLSGSNSSNLGGSRGIPEEALPMIALTIAGELGSNTIQGILSGNPQAQEVARAEIADIASTINNRATSGRYASSSNPYSSVLQGSQYNSLLPENMGTTRSNFSLVGNFISQALSDFNSGELTGNAPNATHYFNPNVVSPAWATNTTGPTVNTGEHSFVTANLKGSNTPEYSKALPTTGPIPTSRTSNVGSTFGGLGDAGGQGLGGFGSPGDFGGGSPSGASASSSGGFGGSGGSAGGGLGGGAVGSSSSSSGMGGSGGGAASVGTSSVGAGAGLGGDSFGGMFGGSPGGGYGSQGNAGIGMGIGSSNSGSMGSTSGMNSAAGSFGGFSAGSLGGSASGLGTGFGAAGTSDYGGFGTGTGAGANAGIVSVESVSTGQVSSGPGGYVSGSSDAGGGGGDGGKVICGYFYNKGKIPARIYKGDLKYSLTKSHPYTKKGYLFWAVPFVLWLEKKKNRPIIDTLLFPFTKGWVYEMAYRVGYTQERYLWGRIITPILTSVCYSIGYFIEKSKDFNMKNKGNKNCTPKKIQVTPDKWTQRPLKKIMK